MWVATAASSAIKQHVPDDNIAYLCIGSETGEVEEPAISSGTKVDSSCCDVEGMHVLAKGQRTSKRAKDVALLDVAADFQWLRGAAVELH